MHLPYSLYRDNPTWVPPLLEKEGQVVGGIAAFVDALVNEHWGEPVGLFGDYEYLNDPEGVRLPRVVPFVIKTPPCPANPAGRAALL